jgi:hypothetical protein
MSTRPLVGCARILCMLGLGLAGVAPARAGDPPPGPELVWTGEVPEDLAPVRDRALALCREKLPLLMRHLDAPGWVPPKRTSIRFDASLDIPACASSEGVRLGVKWFRAHPGDIGAAVHELVHVLQAYPEPKRAEPGAAVKHTKPGWLVEGIADYLRWVVCCPEPRALPDHFAKRSYRESYRTAAVFLDWIAKRSGPQVLLDWNDALRRGVFHEGLIEKGTGKALDPLWAEFQAARP